ncbi:MAG: DUF2834 domain-containing protein [Kordiimonadaceae bacterium]|nr:DUF2834 domain-containing protein [Kordiimonadaceae bacterium]MBO6568814.1 DUF2834 domain-containing protein [Kordiimonadaceae bacterium]MBO6965211.1 DUF2834 domain-containing protein [Kordiimonadaceae bacterium]
MSQTVFRWTIGLLGALFAAAFVAIVVPPLIESGDIIGAFAAGFVNPYSSGYSLDVILCAFILITWVLYEKSARGVKYGWVAIPLCFVPGVATAFAYYLIIRMRRDEVQGQ